MPGRLIMDTNGANGARVAVNGKQQSSDASARPDNTSPPSHPQKRPDQSILTNGDTIPGLGAYPTPNGLSPTSPPAPHMPSAIIDLPPELREITTGFQSLGTLIERVSQDCYDQLGKKIEQLANIQLPPQAPLTNGASHHAGVNGVQDNNSRENREKRSLMLDFANRQREKFIKLLVLSQWSRNVGDIRKMINLLNWSNDQFNDYHEAADAVGRIKFNTHNFKVQNPDMETALSVLSTGTVPMPELGSIYIPPKPLTPPKILKTLRNLNTLLAIRLNLHEDLIPQLRDYRIADGRVTFIFPKEFELDTTISSEDPEIPFFFIDVRFLFTPAPQISSGPLRDQINLKMDDILRAHGLRGAYDFVHDFTLTHKIGILRKQAAEMSRGAWASCLRIEHVHRTLVVQYWVESPQAKSWIEIGIHSGKRKGVRNQDNMITSCLRIKWMRNGKEVTDVQVPMDVEDLSLERILRAVTALHISSILRSIHDKLLESASNALSLKLATSVTDPQDCSLKLQLGEFPAITLAFDAVTGRLFLQPASSLTTRPQLELERLKNPAADGHVTLSKYLCFVVHQTIEREAESAGWTQVRNYTVKPDVMEAETKVNAQRFGFFRCPGFGLSPWVIAYTINLAGERWWAVELTRAASGDTVRACRPLPTTVDGKQPRVTRALFRKLQQYAVCASAYFTAAKSLEKRNVDRAIRFHTYQRKHDSSQSLEDSSIAATVTLPVIWMRFSQLLKGDLGDMKQFASEAITLCYAGFDIDTGEVKLVAKGMLRKSNKLPDILSNTRDDEVAFDASGSFTLVLRTGLGMSCIDILVAKLRTMGRVAHFAQVLQTSGLDCKGISLSCVAFKYAENQAVELLFNASDNSRITIKLAPMNPHRVIITALTELLNNASFQDFTSALSFSLPLCRAFAAIEQRSALSVDLTSTPTIHVRSVDWYRLSYPGLSSHFDIRLKKNRDITEWMIHENSTPPMREERSRMHPTMVEGLKGLFRRVGDGWTGMQSCISASVEGVERAIGSLDEVMRPGSSSAGAPHAPNANGEVSRGDGPDVVVLE